jgi:CheY-like chemotaxis protein
MIDMANEKILVIEDNQMNMMLVRDLLQLGGYTVLEAMDAEKGVQLAREHLPDLILMDIQLPGMDGLEATRIIGQDPVLKKVPVVAMTSYAMKGDEQMAREAGCVGYIAKPLDTRSFSNTVSGFLNSARPEY